MGTQQKGILKYLQSSANSSDVLKTKLQSITLDENEQNTEIKELKGELRLYIKKS